MWVGGHSASAFTPPTPLNAVFKYRTYLHSTWCSASHSHQGEGIDVAWTSRGLRMTIPRKSAANTRTSRECTVGTQCSNNYHVNSGWPPAAHHRTLAAKCCTLSRSLLAPMLIALLTLTFLESHRLLFARRKWECARSLAKCMLPSETMDSFSPCTRNVH